MHLNRSVRSSFSNKLISDCPRWSNETLSSPNQSLISRLILYTNFSFKINEYLFRSFSIMIMRIAKFLGFLIGQAAGLRNRFEYPIHYRIKWLESTVAGDSVISWVSLEMVPARACSSSPSNKRGGIIQRAKQTWGKRFNWQEIILVLKKKFFEITDFRKYPERHFEELKELKFNTVEIKSLVGLFERLW